MNVNYAGVEQLGASGEQAGVVADSQFIGKRLSLRKNFLWNLAGNIVYAGCQWGIVVVLAKLTSAEVVGEFALALAVTAPIFLLSQLQLRAVQATDAKDEYSFGHYLGLRLITSLAAMIVVAAVAFLSYDGKTAWMIVAVGLSKLFESVSDVFYGLMQKHQRMDRIALSGMIKGPLSLLLLSLIIFFTHNLFFGVLGMAAAWAGLLFFFDLPSSRILLSSSEGREGHSGVVPIFDLKQILKLTWLALPLGFVMALNSLNTNIPKYFLEKYWGKGELGVFAALVYLVTVGGIVVNAIGQSVTPRLAQYYASGRIAPYRFLLMRLLLIGAGLGIVGVGVSYYAGDTILSMIYGSEYAQRQDVLVLIMTAGGISYVASCCGYGVTAARILKAQLPLSVVVVLISVSASYYFASKGIIGAVYTQLFSNIATMLLYSILLTGIFCKRMK